MSKLLVFVAIMSAANCQLYGDSSKIGLGFPIHKDEKNVVSGYGQIKPSPLELGAGADWKNVNGHGAALDLSHMPSHGLTTGTLSGRVGLINKDQDKVYAFGSHTRMMDNQFRTLDRSSTAGMGYEHSSRDGRTHVGVQGGATFVPGFKPQPSIMFGVRHNFKK